MRDLLDIVILGIQLPVCALLAMLVSSVALAQQQASGPEIPLRDVLVEIQERSSYRFLYRDALIAGKTIRFESGTDAPILALEKAVEPLGFYLIVDDGRKQVFLLRADETSRSRLTISGEVIDDEHGTRLPYASIVWREDGRLRGTAANEAGAFVVHLDGASLEATHIELSISYVGFAPVRLNVDPHNPPIHLPVRLAPATQFGPELVVSTRALQSEVDTTYHHLVGAGIFSPLGETGVLRSLQSLPSVSLSTAISPGLNVRGSRTDGFEVLLDGLSIFNQNHFFGLFDAFNGDVLQTVGLYYSVTPASFGGPPGGTLAFETRSGSQTGMRRTIGAGNAAVKGTVEGPLLGGRGSWLLSGRRSYLNAVNWFNNAQLIALGLDVGRETGVPAGLTVAPRDRALIPGDASATFYDLHSKIAYEWPGGQRASLSVYLGGDQTLHDAERLAESGPQRQLAPERVETLNDWGNASTGLRLQVPHGSRSFSHALVGFSRYRSTYSKDDFIYTDPAQAYTPLPDTVRHVVRPFHNENELMELKVTHQLDVATRRNGTWTAGYAVHGYDSAYHERSLFRTAFDETHRSILFDVFSEYAGEITRVFNVRLGVRSHYFSLGSAYRLSPRLLARAPLTRVLSAGVGYSRNYQFLHRLSLEQGTNADVWIMSTEAQPPGSVDHYSSGLYLRMSRRFQLQAEAYLKTYRNLREHETSVARRRLRATSPLLDPWLHDSEGLARGIELMVSTGLGSVFWTNSYTLSSMEISNPLIDEGEPFAADWDRRHQFASHLQFVPIPAWVAHLTWVIASGVPNTLALHDPSEPARLGPYHRLDAGVRHRRTLGRVLTEVRANAFNVYGRRNTWYRTPLAVVAATTRGRRVGFMNADVYDLAFQPSFEVSLTF